MSQMVLDEHLHVQTVLSELEGWISVARLRDLRPREHVLDDRVPEILLTLNRLTFITIDHGFWKRRLCHSRYCVLYFALTSEEQSSLPGLLRSVLHVPEFSTRAARMGKVARVDKRTVVYWEAGVKTEVNLPE